MTDPAPITLAAGFEPATREAWLALVDKAIKGGDFEKRLVSRTADGLRIEPLYTRGEDAAPGVFGRTGWDIRTIVIEADPAAANAAILEDLEGGAISVALQLAPDGGLGLPPAIEALGGALSGVNLDMCGVVLVPLGAFWAAATSLDAVWAELGIGNDVRTGAFGADPLGTLAVAGSLDEPLERALGSAATLAKMALPMPGVTVMIADGVPYHNAGASEARELAAMLATLVAYLRACEAENVAPSDSLPKITVSLAADADQFLTIAKVRAARRLVARVADACEAKDSVRRVQYNAATSYRMMTRRDPWTNILRGTLACSSAALGGADAITVLPFTFALGKPGRFARRVARNTQLVLQEEASLGRVADPARGSWYVETLTRDLAAKAWSLFQDIEARGGMAAALQSGFIQDEIAKTAEARAKDIATRRSEITGISAFPRLGDDGVKTEPWQRRAPQPKTKAVEVRPLKPQRVSEPFEVLRDRAEADGKRPRVFLASMGTIADHNQRTTWVRNLLAAGGIEALAADGYADASEAVAAFEISGAAIACICSSDAFNAKHAEAMAKALKAAEAKQVLLAGRPGEREAALRAAGVDTFLFAGQDAVATLSAIHAAFGLP